jgi:hypothetical protein
MLTWQPEAPLICLIFFVDMFFPKNILLKINISLLKYLDGEEANYFQIN